jgi:pantoate--beta-alanine ligase
MQTLSTPAEVVAWADAARARGASIGLVPTMGFLHVGHLSLMERLRGQVDQLIVSIFVNPLQFGPGEDLDRYPRDHAGDLARCASVGVDAVFVTEDLYPPGFSTSVAVGGLTERLCGAYRPTHFAGVTTVVARLFGLTRCDVACFGEKDFQQLVVIRRMVRDLAMPVRLVPGPLVRDEDGLALSSRNAYLSPDERARGLSLHRALFAMRAACEGGEADAGGLLRLGRSLLDVDRLDYLEVVDAETLAPLERVGERPARALVAGYVGRSRLIDNVALGPEIVWT